MHPTNYYIFVILPFSFVHPTNYYIFFTWLRGEFRLKLRFRVVVGQVCDLGIGITWVQVSRLPMPHPDNDRWKCTMFTNKIYVSVCLINKIPLVNIYTGWTTWHNGINYNNNDRNHNNDNNVQKMTSMFILNCYGSTKPAINVQTFLLKGEW